MIHKETISSSPCLKIYSLKPPAGNSGRARIGNKAKGQIRLFQCGFKCPHSLFIDDDFFGFFQRQHDLHPGLIDTIREENLSSRFAVRSSSNLEDSSLRSFAGVFKTILNVPNQAEALKNAIIDCYRSSDTPEFWEFIAKKNLNKKRIRFGLIIQEMIEATISGVLFTSTPQNPTDQHYRIEYCSGTGDRLTGGFLTGNAITVEKGSGKIAQQEGNLFIPQKILNRLLQIAKDIETKFRYPQDIEFVVSTSNDDIYLLQTRPITAFSYTPEYVIQQESNKIREIFESNYQAYGLYPVLSSTNISELFPIATPLGFSIFKTIFAGTNEHEGGISRGRKSLEYAEVKPEELNGLFLTIGNQARVNLYIDALTFRLKSMEENSYRKLAVKHYLDIIRENENKANYPELEVYFQSDMLNDWKIFPEPEASCWREQQAQFIKDLKYNKIPQIRATVDRFLKQNDEYYREELTRDFRTLRQKELKNYLVKYIHYLRNEFCLQYVIIARIGYLSAYLVQKHLQKFIANINLKGDQNHSETSLQDVVDKYFNDLLASENCPDEYKIPDSIEHELKVKKREVSPGKFLEIFGHIGSLDISTPRLIESGENLLTNLLSVHNDKTDSPEITPAGLKTPLIDAMLISLTPDIKFWVKQAKLFMTLRERYSFELQKIFFLIKRIITELALRSKLEEFIHYLTIEKLIYGKKLNSSYRIEAIKMKAYYEACKCIEVKKVIKQIDDVNISLKKIHTPTDDMLYRAHSGKTIHYGMGEAKGICLKAKDSQEFYNKLVNFKKKGYNDIIGFFKGLELSYLNLIELNGIVTENGGYLAHAATIARENNLPYITNINIDIFDDGDYIILDPGNHQIVYRKTGEILK